MWCCMLIGFLWFGAVAGMQRLCDRGITLWIWDVGIFVHLGWIYLIWWCKELSLWWQWNDAVYLVIYFVWFSLLWCCVALIWLPLWWCGFWDFGVFFHLAGFLWFGLVGVVQWLSLLNSLRCGAFWDFKMFFHFWLVIFDLVLCSSCDDCLCGNREMMLWISDFGVFLHLGLFSLHWRNSLTWCRVFLDFGVFFAFWLVFFDMDLTMWVSCNDCHVVNMNEYVAAYFGVSGCFFIWVGCLWFGAVFVMQWMSLWLQSKKRWILGFVLVGFFDLVCGF